MNIKTAINSLPKDTYCESLENLFGERDVQVKVTNSGKRKVSIEGYSGAITLWKLASKVLFYAEDCYQTGRWTVRERIAAMNLDKRLQKLFRMSDTCL